MDQFLALQLLQGFKALYIMPSHLLYKPCFSMNIFALIHLLEQKCNDVVDS